MKTKILFRIMTLLLLMAEASEAWAAEGITTFPYWTDFSSSTEPFTGGETNNDNVNIGSVLRVTNSTATAEFARVYDIKPTETVTLTFTAYHGLLVNTNKTSSVSIKNSEGVTLVGYTYNHTSGNVIDVKIGGNTVSGFETFNARSYYNNDQIANGIEGNGKPYKAGSGTYNPSITMRISGDGWVLFNLYLSNKSIDQSYWVNIGNVTKNLSSIVVESNCDNSDRTICIDNLFLQSTLYYQDYESDGMSSDWTSRHAGRFTPVILDEGTNHFASVNQDERFNSGNNGTTLTCTSLQGCVMPGKDYELSFDLKLSNANTDAPIFRVYDAANTGVIFSLTPTAASYIDTWIVNGTKTVTLPGSTNGIYTNLSQVTWCSIIIKREGQKTYVEIKNKATDASILAREELPSSSIGGLGKMEFVTGKSGANFAIDNVWVVSYESLALSWTADNATVGILDVGNSNPNTVDALPALSHKYTVSTYGSSNEQVAKFWGSQIHIVGVGSTLVYATDVNGNHAGYLLTVTGTTVTPVVTTDKLEFTEEGVLANSLDANGQKTHVLSTGLTITYGYTGESSVVVNSSMGSVLKIIDANGFSHPNISSPFSESNPAPDAYGGSYVKLEASEVGYLIVQGNVSSTRTVIYRANGAALTPIYDDTRGNMRVELSVGTYYLYNRRLAADESSSSYIPLVHSISFVHAYFEESYQVTIIPSGNTYPLQTVYGLSSPIYTIVGYAGDLEPVANRPTIVGSNITNINYPGAIKIQAESGGNSATYVLTVAYPATPYPGKLWDFNQYYETYQPPLSIDEAGGLSGFPRIDANKDGTVNLTNTEGGSANITDEYGDAWVAELKNANYGAGRDARWRRVNAVHGDNAFIVSETAGLVFNTGGKGFFVRNDRVKHNCWGHVGIRQYGASFTIPQLTAGDIVEINWKRESGGAGGEYTATNVTDLRGKPVNEQFEITGSQNGTTGGVLDIYKNPGYTSFIATGGDVTFTLRDVGATDILSIRIYNGGYRSTMRTIQGSNHQAPQTAMLLDYQDNSETNYNYQEYEYDYCNVLNSTNTGPAIYVLKGYRRGEDNLECVSGTNAALSPTPFEDNDAAYPAYPVTEAESERLYDLRKNLVGFRMYNRTWQSSRNSYNNGKVGASGGWGKVTIRMNNYTNDMKYVIGYTNDVTMTFGSRPHQLYPYTWDFTNISAQYERGKPTNVYNTIINEDQYDTNWNNTSNGVFSLDIENADQYGSQYVPGAVLVTTDKALSKVTYYDSGGVLRTLGGLGHALDEFDGLGVNGKISFDSDQQQPSSARKKESLRRAGFGTVSLLSFSMDNYKIVKSSEVIDGETIVTDWKNATGTDLAAGNGWVKFGADRITETAIAACGFAYKCDFDVSNTDRGIYLRPARKLKNGDIITIKLYATSTPNGSNYGLCIYPEYSNTAAATLFISSGVKNTEATLSYTVTDGDGLNDQSMIKIYRNPSYSVYLSEVQITGDASSEPVRREIFCETQTTLTIPEVNANSKQDWIYVSASDAPTAVVNATLVSSGTDGPDANTDHDVYKYKVTAAGDAYLTFAMNTRIYKIGVTHILKEIHPVGGTGWATEIRKHHIDHELIGYFTNNDVNAYTVKYDSYDMKTATVALTPINEDGYVPEKTGVVMRLDNTGHLSDANSGKYVPLFYPSYTRPASSTPVDFPTNNMMYNVDEGIESNNRNYNETISVGGVNYTKFILTNRYWTFNKDHALGDDESASPNTADAAGFYRMHIWKSGADIETKNTMKANTAWLLVRSDNLPNAVWTLQEGYSAAHGMDLLGVYNIVGPGSETAIRELQDNGITASGDTDKANGETWYTLNGLKLSGKPVTPGLYMHGGRKVIIR